LAKGVGHIFFYNVLVLPDSIPVPSLPLKVMFFAWLAALGKILTMDNLKKRHIIVVD
jgi:hypothetical protein